MVKPPKTMEPSAIKDMAKAGRDKQKAFIDDSFHVYMARKIDMQRNQFGCIQLPPAPLSVKASPIVKELSQYGQNNRKSPRFQPQPYFGGDIQPGQQLTVELVHSDPPQQMKKFGVDAVVKRLQQRYGVVDNPLSSIVAPNTTSKKRRRHEIPNNHAHGNMKCPMTSSHEDKVVFTGDEDVPIDKSFDNNGCKNVLPAELALNKYLCDPNSIKTRSSLEDTFHTSYDDVENVEKQCSPCKRKKETIRPDLFFFGIVVLINGYTNPDAATLQRLLQKHGGDVEKYETTRITHIIAERLSKAKANVYKKQQRNPTPVCQPKWITDSVQAYKLLPYQNYVIKDIMIEKNTRSVASLFQPKNTTSLSTKTVLENGMESIKTLQINKKYKLEDDTNKLNQSYYLSEEDIAKESQGPITASPSGRNNIEWYEGRNLNETCRSDSVQHYGSLIEVNSSAALIRQELHSSKESKKDERYINGNIRTVGTDPNFLESFFASSRLSFIGSYRQRQHQQQSPSMKRNPVDTNSATLERFVFHVDMDCFFASVVLRKYPQYKDQPVAISHNSDTADHGVRQVFKDSTSECATSNYAARKYGIKKGMFLSRAKELCPNLIVLPYDYEGYEEVSDIVSDVLDRHASEFNGYVEHVSCDEAYMEIFVPVDEIKIPHAVVAEVAESIRKEILALTMCTASVGVATNKFLAKLATDHVKPNRSFVMDDYRAILMPVKLRDLYGIGYKMGKRLEDAGLFSVQDIWNIGDNAETELCKILGAGLGKKIHGYCYGKDDRCIQASDRKTISAECNYGVRFDGPYGVDYMMKGLCKEVEKRMKNVGVRGKKITLKVKQRKSGAPPPPKYLGHGSCHNLSKTGEVRTKEATSNWKSFFDVAMDMYRELKVEKDDVRGMGIVISKLVNDVSDGLQESNGTHSISKWFNRHTEKSSRKVDFLLPAHNHDKVVGTAVDDDLKKTDIACIESTRNMTAEDNSGCNDLVLPALSQIHMSQVNALPSPMRKEIVAKMDNEKNKVTYDAHTLPNSLRDARYHQTDVKRMLRLASVKAGTAALVNETGQAISLTQLDCLPLEVQLELANEDANGYGRISPMKKSQNRTSTAGANRPIVASERSVAKMNMISQPVQVGNDGDDSDVRSNDTRIDYVKTNFFLDNAMPLIDYMNENPDADRIAIRNVSAFLCICVTENRLSDTVVLLQTIKKHGNDRWSNDGFEVIFNSVDSRVQQHFRANLDKKWVLQL